jgi:hypothetical protein
MRIRAVFAALLLAGALSGGAQDWSGPEFRVSAGSGHSPLVGATEDGQFVVAWSRSGLYAWEHVFARSYDAQADARGPEFQVSVWSSGSQRLTGVAAAADGGFRVVWDGVDGSVHGVYAQSYDAAGTPAAPEAILVSAHTTGDQRWGAVASQPDGSFVVVWQSSGQDGDANGVFGRRFDASGTPLAPEFQVNATTTGSQGMPTVTAGPLGGFIVTWVSGSTMWARRYDASGASQGDEFVLDSAATPAYASIAVGPAGNFVVAWTASEAAGSYESNVFARRFEASGEPDGEAFLISSHTSGNQWFPFPTFDAGGGLLIVWSESGDVFGRRYDPSGVAQGPQFRINESTDWTQGFARAAAAGPGRFVVVWHGGRYGINYAIYGRRLGDPVFTDGFESGDISRWAGATGSDALAVSAAAAQAGSAFGLQARLDGGDVYVQDDSPVDEPRYRARLVFDPNGFDPGEAQRHLRVRLFMAFAEGPSRRVLLVVVRRRNGEYGVMARGRLDDGRRVDTGFFPITDAPHAVEVDWLRATTPGASDGALRMWIDGVAQATVPDLANYSGAVDYARMGALGVKGGASGTLYADEFESRRESRIGP